MNDRRKNIKRVFWLYFALVFVLQIYLIKYIFFDSKNFVTSPYNPRLTLMEKNIKRGYIYDSKGTVLAESNFEGDRYKRNYTTGTNFVHLLGNVLHQKSGVEVKYNFSMQKLNMEIFQRIKREMFGTELKGDNVKITVEADFQKYVANQLGNNKGAIVAMEPSTGKILAMVSYPNYDPNNIANDWKTLNKDEKNAPLLNRASTGLYTPGSVFKVVTSLMIMRTIPDYENYTYTCKGEDTFGESKIRCFNNTVHGEVNLDKALTHSCNTYFSHMSTKFDNNEFKKLTEQLYFNKTFNFPLEYNKSSFVLDNKSDLNETVQTSFGQAKTLMTPLHISLLTSSIANGGIMMEPYILDYIETEGNIQKNKTIPKMLSQVMTTEEAEKLNKMMWNVVSYGTAKKAAINNIEVSGKTGTAQNHSGNDHGLFTAFAPSDNPKIVVSVVLEQAGAGGTGKSVEMTKNILNYYLKK